MGKDFIFHKRTDNCKNLILFVHGFTGDAEDTWRNANSCSFPSLLLNNSYIQSHFDIAAYSYFTTLLDLFADAKEKVRWLKSLIRSKTHVKERNLDIDELSNILGNHIRFTLEDYDNIYVIAHSMGGLITKNLISKELSESGETKIRLFISLAVPHNGATLSVLGGIISGNLQIHNLNPVEGFLSALNQKWVHLDLKPTTKYFYGSYDDIVTKHSAVAVDKIEKDIISVPEDHNSISKPEDEESLVYKSVTQFIIGEHNNTKLREAGFQNLPDDKDFDNEIFVIKLIVVGIAEETQKNAKELYFNAEYMRKLFSSKHDKKELQRLFENIRQLYKDSYDGYLADQDKNSGKLLAEVHSKITDHDSTLLKSLIPVIQNYHKKGMLHQLANREDRDIWWSQSRDLRLNGDNE
jgi:pimeloyl-ACP methyl ester carboxylesterase